MLREDGSDLLEELPQLLVIGRGLNRGSNGGVARGTVQVAFQANPALGGDIAHHVRRQYLGQVVTMYADAH